MKISAKRPNIILGAATGAAVLLSVIVGWTSIPLGISGQWVWQRQDFDWIQVLLPFLFELPVFLIAGGAAYGLYRKKLSPYLSLLILLAGLHFVPSVWDAGVAGRGENVVAFMDLYTGGYLNEAAKIQEPGVFFAAYADKMGLDAEPSNHLDVHPPGNVYFSYLVLQFCRQVPWSGSIANHFLSADDRHALNEIKQHQVFIDLPDDPHIYNAAILLLVLSNLAVFAGNVLIILTAAKLLGGFKPEIVFGALFLGFVPGGPALFTGHFDVFMYFWGALAVLMIVSIWKAENNTRRLVFASLTGLVLALAVSSTLAFGALIILCGAGILCLKLPLKEKIYTLAAFGGTGLLFVGILWLSTGVNLVECCYYASRNNAAYFRESGRSILMWWPWNVFDLMLFGGPLLFLLMICQPYRAKLRNLNLRRIFAYLSLSILLLLLVSPFSRGEMGRLLLFFLPLCSVTAVLTLNSPGWCSCSKLLFILAIASNIFLIYVIRVALKLAIVY